MNEKQALMVTFLCGLVAGFAAAILLVAVSMP